MSMQVKEKNTIEICKNVKVGNVQVVTAKNDNIFVKFECNGTQITLNSKNGKISLFPFRCCNCDCSIDYDDVRYLENGECVCIDCSIHCPNCDQTVLDDDSVVALREIRGNYTEVYVCQCCADNQHRQIAVF